MFLVVNADAVAKPDAVVVNFQRAGSAQLTVVRSRGQDQLTDVAEEELAEVWQSLELDFLLLHLLLRGARGQLEEFNVVVLRAGGFGFG